MGKLIFDPENHTYKYDGNLLPSVTGLLRPFYEYSAVPADILAARAEEGRNVHAMCRLCLEGRLDEEGLTEYMAEALKQFKEFCYEHGKKLGLEYAVCEMPMVNKKLMYCGTPDIVCYRESGKKIPVIDIKTRELSPAVDILQISGGYSGLIAEQLGISALKVHSAFDGYVLEIIPGKQWRLRPAMDRQAWPMFARLVKDYWHNKETEKLIEQWKESKK